MYINVFLCSLFFIYSSALKKINIKTKKNSIHNNIKLKFQNNEYYDDLNIIQKFKFYFQKDDYNEVINNLINNKISKIFIDSNYKKLVSIDNLPQDEIYYNHFHSADINPIIIPNIVEITSKEHIPIYFVNFTPEYILNLQNIGETLLAILGNGIPLFFLLFFLASLRNVNSFSSPQNNINSKNKINNSNKNLFNLFNNANSEETQFIKPNVSLENWAGSPEVIEECKEVISYIENKIKYKQIGAEMPKGILLEGPPGTGKTLLAKAIASETNSTFISMSGSEFVELFVGMGAARVRELFESARNERPCIIFIDEIDAVGRQRGAGINMANDEREQTLNQLLYEMDGFNDNEDILVMAATNRKDILDQALLRPGRFDRIIKVPLPDKSSREKILEFYFKNKNTEKNFDIQAIAELTDGFSGAELKNLINEAAIISARNNYTIIQEKYIFDAFEKSIVGLIKKNYTTSPLTQIRVAIHESGHTLLALKFNEYFDFQKVSIQPTYNGAGGYTIFSEKPEIKEGGLYTKDMLKKRLIITMGGKAAEAVYYGNDFMSLGAIQDLKQANNLAKKMIGNFGMGDKLEVFFNEDIDDDSNPFLGRSLSVSDKYSQHTRYIMDKESINLVKEAYSEAKEILEKNKYKLIEFSELLQNNTIIYKKDIENDIEKFI
jgi:cell division protease FtsH